MKINTEVLKNLVSKASKGAVNNKLIPITGFMSIEVINNKFVLTTTDGNNILKVTYELQNEQDFYTIVNAETFSKLVAKLTTEYTEFIVEDSFLKINADGIYKLNIAVDVEGNVVRFNNIPEFNNGIPININDLKTNIETAKVAVAQTMQVPVLTGYYLADKIITTDGQKVCYIKSDVCKESILINSSTADLLQLFDSDTSLSYNSDSELFFNSSNVSLYCKQLYGKDIYPVDSVENLLKTEYKNKLQVSKENLLNVLDRMSIFVSQYDNNGIVLDMSENGLTVTSQKSNAKELLTTIDIIEEPYRCFVDIEMLKSAVERVSTDFIEMHYGSKSSLKIVDGNNTMIISLLSE